MPVFMVAVSSPCPEVFHYAAKHRCSVFEPVLGSHTGLSKMHRRRIMATLCVGIAASDIMPLLMKILQRSMAFDISGPDACNGGACHRAVTYCLCFERFCCDLEACPLCDTLGGCLSSFYTTPQTAGTVHEAACQHRTATLGGASWCSVFEPVLGSHTGLSKMHRRRIMATLCVGIAASDIMPLLMKILQTSMAFDISGPDACNGGACRRAVTYCLCFERFCCDLEACPLCDTLGGCLSSFYTTPQTAGTVHEAACQHRTATLGGASWCSVFEPVLGSHTGLSKMHRRRIMATLCVGIAASDIMPLLMKILQRSMAFDISGPDACNGGACRRAVTYCLCFERFCCDLEACPLCDTLGGCLSSFYTTPQTAGTVHEAACQHRTATLGGASWCSVFEPVLGSHTGLSKMHRRRIMATLCVGIAASDIMPLLMKILQRSMAFDISGPDACNGGACRRAVTYCLCFERFCCDLEACPLCDTFGGCLSSFYTTPQTAGTVHEAACQHRTATLGGASWCSVFEPVLGSHTGLSKMHRRRIMATLCVGIAASDIMPLLMKILQTSMAFDISGPGACNGGACRRAVTYCLCIERFCCDLEACPLCDTLGGCLSSFYTTPQTAGTVHEAACQHRTATLGGASWCSVFEPVLGSHTGLSKMHRRRIMATLCVGIAASDIMPLLMKILQRSMAFDISGPDACNGGACRRAVTYCLCFERFCCDLEACPLCDTLGGCLSSFYTTPQTAGTVHEAACQHRTATLGGASWCSVFEPVLGSHTGLSKMHRRRIMATLCVGIAASDIMPLLMKILQRSMAFDISGPDACNGGACRRAVTYCLCFERFCCDLEACPLCDTLGGCLSSFYTTPQTAGTVHEAACQHRTATLGGASWCSVFEPVLGSHTGLSKMHRRRIMATLCVGIAASDIMPLLMKILQRSMAFDISGPDACNGGACRRAVTYCLCFERFCCDLEACPLCDTLGGCLSSFYTTPQTAGAVHEAACQDRTATLGGASWCSVFEPVLGSHTGLSKMHRRRIMATLCVGIAASDIMPLLMKILQRSMAFDISGPDACNGGACRRAVTYCLCFERFCCDLEACPLCDTLGGCLSSFYTTPQTAGAVHEAACQHRTATLGGASWCSVFEPVLGSHTGLSKMHRRRIMATLCIGIAASDIMPLLMKILQRSMAFDISGPDACNGGACRRAVTYCLCFERFCCDLEACPLCDTLGGCLSPFYTTPQTAGTVHEAACQHRTATLGGASWCSVFEPVLGSHTGLSKMHRRRIMATLCVGIAASDIMPLLMKILQRSMAFDISGPDACNGGACRRAVTYCLCFERFCCDLEACPL